MDLEKLRRSLLYRLESIDGESNFTVIEDKVNKLSHQISQLKSDLSDVASLFHLLKDNKKRLTLLNIEDTDYPPEPGYHPIYSASIFQSVILCVATSKLTPTFTIGKPLKAKRLGYSLRSICFIAESASLLSFNSKR